MYLNTNSPQQISGGESHSSYEHYSMSQVNNQKPVVHRDYQEQSQSWGQPSPTGSNYPNYSDSERNAASKTRLLSNSSSVIDRSVPIQPEPIKVNQQQLFNSQCRIGEPATIPRVDSFRQHQHYQEQQQQQQQHQRSNSYSRITQSNGQRQLQQGLAANQHSHNVPHFHGFQFQAMPGSLLIEIFDIVNTALTR